ncbi:LLM class flavin-dependent oxidoreductase [Streptomyces sp. OR43]|uniref:LLM class flavin-dependent oxidoreductase n=1 Tax=Streptomyces sp. or43 TaxID=2478957 RepID=UPI0021C59DCE|nr:LLM class flavin-dependent oxidoreductase [Streptomyces sp. or43]
MQVANETVLADSAGVDALGKHPRPAYAASTPETAPAGIATRTERIQLTSGITVLSSDDPVLGHTNRSRPWESAGAG